MKKILSLVLVLLLALGTTLNVFAITPFDIPVPEFTAKLGDTEVTETLESYQKGIELMINSYFNDVQDSTYEKEITKMAALGIVKKTGDSFRPEDDITGYEAVELMVRLMGNEEAVVTRVLNQAAGMNDQALANLFTDEYVIEAETLGLFGDGEDYNLYAPIDRERIALWTARALGLQEVFADQNNLYSYTDWQTIDPGNRGLIEALLQERVMSPMNDGSFNPEGTMSRGEMTSILSEAHDLIQADRNVVSDYGLVIGKVESTEYVDGETIKVVTMTVKNVDDTLTNIVARENMDRNQKNDFVSYRAGLVSDSRNVQIGDEIKYYTQDDAVMFTEAISDFTVLEKMNQTNENAENTSVFFGRISEIVDATRWDNAENFLTRRFRVVNYTGDVVDIIVDNNLTTGIKGDIITYKNGQVGGTDMLAIGDSIEYVATIENEVLYIKVKEVETKVISGTVMSVNTTSTPSSLAVFSYDNQVYELAVTPYALITVNQRVATLDDLQYGQDIQLTVLDGNVTEIVSETYTGEPGYIPAFGKKQLGEVYKIYNDAVSFKLDNGIIERYVITDDTAILKGGSSITRNALKEGDQAKLYFNDIYTDEIARLEIEGVERLIKQVYKGKLKQVNVATRTVTIQEPYTIVNNVWTLSDNYSKDVVLDQNASIYDGDDYVKIEDFSKNYLGKTIYVVVEDSYGQENGVKVSIKSGGELVFYDQIDEVNLPLNRLELESKQNITVTDGTIVLKDGRIVDINRLDEEDNVLVIGDYYKGETKANVLKLVTMTDTLFESIRIGAIEDVNQSTYSLKFHTQIAGNQISSVTQTESLNYYYFTETTIQDYTTGKAVDVEAVNFFNEEYARIENKSTDGDGYPYERYYGVFVLDESGRGTIGMTFRKNGLLSGENYDDDETSADGIAELMDETLESAVLTRGVMNDIDTTWNRFELTDSHDWVSYSGEWSASYNDIWVEYTSALIIKGEEVIDADEVEEGDYLYVFRILEDAFVIFVHEE